MRRARKRDAKNAYIRYKFRHAALADCVLTGIENCLSPDLVEKNRKCRVRTVRAVLREQEFQVSMGRKVVDQDVLAQVSRDKSSWAVRRAVTIGCSQSKVRE